jgi:hypothetical protein
MQTPSWRLHDLGCGVNPAPIFPHVRGNMARGKVIHGAENALPALSPTFPARRNRRAEITSFAAV